MIFVTVGTHEQPFNRLIQKVDKLKRDGVIKDDVIIQTGFSTYEPKYCQWSKLIPYQQMVKNVADARIVITHGGPASFIMPLQIGKTPIVVPRQHQYNEHMLKPFWKDKNRFWVTFDKEDARSLLEGEKVYPCYFPTNRSIKALIKNTKIAWDVLHKEKPDLIISCGAAVAVPFFYIGKMMGAKLVYIEVFDRIDKPTMTGKMVYPVVDKFVVQWEEQKKVYPKAVNLGSIF